MGFHFNHTIQVNSSYKLISKRWEYYILRYQDCNVVPYHATLLLLLGAHLNVQCINTSFWSYYSLKYAMKCEPQGAIHMDTKNVKQLGICGASNAQLQLIASLVIVKRVRI